MVSNNELKSLFAPVEPKDIDFRVQTLMKWSGKVVAQIICYKDARYDMNILDQVVGQQNWQKVYSVAGNMVVCGVGINCEDSGWVWKWDTGDPDNEQNKEKSLASDSFKRACFNWGIGRELYEWPKIFVELKEDEYEEQNGRLKAKSKLRPKDWEWAVERGEGNEITKLTAYNKGEKRFEYSAKKKYASPESDKAEYWINELKSAKGKSAVVSVFERTPANIKENSAYKAVLEEKRKEIKPKNTQDAKADQ